MLWVHPPTGTRQMHSSFNCSCKILATQFAYFSPTQSSLRFLMYRENAYMPIYIYICLYKWLLYIRKMPVHVQNAWRLIPSFLSLTFHSKITFFCHLQWKYRILSWNIVYGLDLWKCKTAFKILTSLIVLGISRKKLWWMYKKRYLIIIQK